MTEKSYHLYIEFWSKDKYGEHVLKIIELEYPTMTNLTTIKEDIEELLKIKQSEKFNDKVIR